MCMGLHHDTHAFHTKGLLDLNERGPEWVVILVADFDWPCNFCSIMGLTFVILLCACSIGRGVAGCFWSSSGEVLPGSQGQ